MITQCASGASLALSVALLLSACGGDVKTGSVSQPPLCATPAAGKSDITPVVVPKGSDGIDGVPAISENATDVTKKPTIAKGSGAAPTCLVVRDLVDGTGKAAVATDTVQVQYVGATYADGQEFDASWPDPVPFPLNRVVPGFTGGITGMKIGQRREIVMPGVLGYGDNPPPGYPAGALVFVVDLIAIA